MIEDQVLNELFLEPIRMCADYRPAFGQTDEDGIDLVAFHRLYGADSFYSWIGLNDPLVYAAHKAAGGLTSVYRQIGVGSERLLRAVLKDAFALTEEQSSWQYEYDRPDGRKGVHKLDARITTTDVLDGKRESFRNWLRQIGSALRLAPENRRGLRGAVFEIRQGYKSADSKRQNADLRFGMRAYQARVVPVLLVLSCQVSEPVIRRYRGDSILVLTGCLDDDAAVSTFAFFREVVGFDLAAYFERNSETLRLEIRRGIQALLNP